MEKKLAGDIAHSGGGGHEKPVIIYLGYNKQMEPLLRSFAARYITHTVARARAHTQESINWNSIVSLSIV